MATIYFKHKDNKSIKKGYKPLGKKWRRRFYVSLGTNLLFLLYFFFPNEFNNYYNKAITFLKDRGVISFMGNKYNNKDEFLAKMAEIESSGGKNFEHQEIRDPSSIHKGDRAIGTYGFMPNTVKELINRRRLRKTITPDMQDTDSLDSEQMKEALENNPELEKQLADDMYEHLKNKMVGDEEKMAYGWQYGHNTDPNKLPAKKLNETDRIQKFRLLKKVIGNK